MSPTTETLASVVLTVVACVTAYLLGRRDKQNEQRARGFLEGWNAAIDAAGRAVRSPTPEGTASFSVSESHRQAQLRNAQEGQQ